MLSSIREWKVLLRSAMSALWLFKISAQDTGIHHQLVPEDLTRPVASFPRPPRFLVSVGSVDLGLQRAAPSRWKVQRWCFREAEELPKDLPWLQW